MTGVVKWFNAALGYGFVRDDISNKEYFVHHADLLTPPDAEGRRNLEKGQLVKFSLGLDRDQRQKAVQVEVI
jgi:cold shock CspA family protein